MNDFDQFDTPAAAPASPSGPMVINIGTQPVEQPAAPTPTAPTAPVAQAGNPFDQFDNTPAPAAPSAQASNPFDQFDNVAHETSTQNQPPQKPGTTTLPSAVETPLSLLASAGGRVENALGGVAETLAPISHLGATDLTGNQPTPDQIEQSLQKGAGEVNQDVSAVEKAHPLLGNVGAFAGDVLPYAAAPMGGSLKAASGIGGLIGALQGITKPVETGEDYNRADPARIAEDTALGAAGPTLIKGATSALSGLSEPVKYLAKAIGATPDKVQTAVIQAAQDSGITDLPLSAQTQSRFVRSMESYLQNSGMTGDIYDKLKNGFDSSFSKSYADMLDNVSADKRPAAAIGEQAQSIVQSGHQAKQDLIKNAVGDILHRISPDTREAGVLGEEGKGALKEASDAGQEQVGKAYETLERRLPDTLTYHAPNATAFANDFLAKSKPLIKPGGAENLVTKVMQDFTSATKPPAPQSIVLSGRTFTPGTPEYAALTKSGIAPQVPEHEAPPVSRLLATRRTVNSMMQSDEMGGVRKVLGGFNAALGKDIQEGLEGTSYANELAKADSLFSKQVGTYRIGAITGKIFGETPENVVKSIKNPSDVAKLQAALADPKYAPVVQAIKRAKVQEIIGPALTDVSGNLQSNNLGSIFRADSKTAPLLRSLMAPKDFADLQKLGQDAVTYNNKLYRNETLRSMIFGQTPENVIKSLTEPSDVAKLEAALSDPKYKPVVDAIKRARISDILGTKLYDNQGNIRVGNFAGAFREDQRNGPLLQSLVGPQQWKKLQNLRTVASGVQEGASQFLNSSKTAYARTDLGIAATAAAQAVQGIIQMAHGNLLAGVSLIGSGLATSYTPYLGARLLTSPAFIRAATRAASTFKSNPSGAGPTLRALAQTVSAAAPGTRRDGGQPVAKTTIAAPPNLQTINPHSANDYVSKTVAHESGGNPNARAKTSGAVGAGQFIPKTWARMIENYRPELMVGKSLRQIMDLRRDSALSREMTAHYAEENGEQLRKAGLPVNDTTKYLAHFLGPTDTKRLLSARIGTPAVQVLSPASVRANRSVLAGKKAEDVLRWAQKAMGNLPEPAAGPPQR